MPPKKSKSFNSEQLLSLYKAINTPYITYEEASKLLKATIAPLKELRTQLIAENDSASKKLLAKVEETIKEAQSNLRAATQALKQAEKNSLRRVEDVEKLVVSSISQIRSEIPDTTYLRLAVEELQEREVEVEEETPEEIRDKLETLEGDERLDYTAIDGLEDLVKKYMKTYAPPMQANMQVSSFPKHESFTMNGSDTTVTLTQGVSAAGTAIIVRYQGQTLDLTTHYTVSGNKITLVGFTPEVDTTISVTYW